MADADYERVPVTNWAELTDHLREFAAGGNISESNDGISVAVGNARLSITREGHVEAGMPLHDFEDDAVEALYFDHDRGRVRVEGGGRSYEFRRPS